MEKKLIRVLSGGEAAAFAMKQIEPDVMAAYPISPQTPIIEHFANYVANGEVKTEFIRVESEHSALSACVGASASGVRAMTATASQGLALMFEILYIASGLRLPIVINLTNRALSAPVNIHCDHADSMAARDSGFLQFYAEDVQEVYDMNFIGLKVAEKTRFPALVCQDGYILSHCVQNLEINEDSKVKKFIGNYKADYSLFEFNNPITIGNIDFFDYYFEHKKQQMEDFDKTKIAIKEVFKEYYTLTGRKYDFYETYKLKDAKYVIVAIGSSCGTIKEKIDELRKKGKKVGLLKVTVFRPFVNFTNLLVDKKVIAVLDKTPVFGSYGPLFTEIRSEFYETKKKPKIVNYIYGLGGRELNLEMVEKVFNDLEKKPKLMNYLGVKNEH